MLNPTLVSPIGKAIETAALRAFEDRLLGDIILPSDHRFESARRLWSRMPDPRRPGAIVRCAAPVDVVRTIDFARNNQLEVAVRAGGHSFAADSLCDGGMLIDLSPMRGIRVDSVKRVARAKAGLMAGEFDQATQALGLATVLGECTGVGVSGYTLGGGLGRLMGQYGAACDNLLCVELVDAEGEVFHASAHENEDLFWAIRGGGGNFGIVTSLEYQLYPVHHILSGTLTYPISDTRAVLTFLNDYMINAPDELDVIIDIGNQGLMMSAPAVMEPIVNLTVSYCGDLARGEAALKPLRSFRKPAVDRIRARTYLQAQAFADIRPLVEFASTGGCMALETGFIERLGEKIIDIIEAFSADAPPCFWIAAEHYLHGAICRPAPNHTAFALRQPGYTSRIFSAWRDSNQGDVSIKWVKDLSAALEPFGNDKLYLNYLTEGLGEQGVRTAYATNYERLAMLKSKYDPTNFFHSNRNIHPRATGREGSEH